jgi:hypothetical protein
LHLHYEGDIIQLNEERHVPAGERCMMIFLEVAIGALGLALLTTPVFIALADKRKMTRPE